MAKPSLVLTCGDYNGIGTEIIIKAFNDPLIQDIGDFRVFGAPNIFELAFSAQPYKFQKQYLAGYNFVHNLLEKNTSYKPISVKDFSPGKATPDSGAHAYDYLAQALKFCKENQWQGVVTAPIQKEFFFTNDAKFSGQTELIADLYGESDSLMFMIDKNIRVAVVTTHIPVQRISAEINKEKIIAKGKILYTSLTRDFGIENPVIAVTGLNPHCGDGGLIGSEEADIIVPAVDELKTTGGDWHGPLPADTLFVRKNIERYDGCLAMYHDQGLIPFKIYSGIGGINFTAGLSIVRTSPDHGVAMDIVGKGIADETSMKEAIKLAAEIVTRRRN